ncbi:MAG: VIT domain-containing protein, partial [Planctomycetales bacterium]
MIRRFATPTALFALSAMLVAPGAIQACFVRSPQPVQVWLDHVEVEVTDQVAVKTYHCTFLNPNPRAVVGGVCYMELDPGARVHDMVCVVNGKEAQAEILDVKKAKQVFSDMVKEGGSPALLEYYGNQ